MENNTKILLLAGVAAVALMTISMYGLLESPERTFAENEKIIADAIASREARMTPEERVSRDAAKIAADQAAAEASAAARAEQARQDFLPSARGACLITLKRTLHDPGSAQFGLTSEWPSSIADDGKAHVLARFRAKNAFGALRLVNYICVVERVGATDMRVVKLEQLP